MRVLTTTLCLLAASACRTAPTHADDDLELLARHLTGSFSSAAQAEADPENYFDIRLRTVRIWTAREDGPWLYVEQAAATSLERPYRQRVYHLVAGTGGLESRVYLLPGDPLEWAGAWRAPERFDTLAPDALVEREGCEIHLRRAGDGFVGSTRGEGCASALGDAVYATSEVQLEPGLLTSWDRGFDAEGRQAWGATAGPYEFVRESE